MHLPLILINGHFTIQCTMSYFSVRLEMLWTFPIIFYVHIVRLSPNELTPNLNIAPFSRHESRSLLTLQRNNLLSPKSSAFNDLRRRQNMENYPKHFFPTFKVSEEKSSVFPIFRFIYPEAIDIFLCIYSAGKVKNIGGSLSIIAI